jgi:DNA-binding response OmpR family regulator
MLVDLGMFGMYSNQVAQEIRQYSRLDATVLVAISYYGSEENRVSTRSAGFDLHLVKPLDPDQLRALLSSPPTASSEASAGCDLKPYATEPLGR